jgi:tetratricopeptide (TPR) repeat protein
MTLTNTDAQDAYTDGSRPPAAPVSPEERSRIKKQMADQAVKLAIGGRWDEASDLNRNMLTLLGEEPETYNRLGKALMELGKVADARAAYSRSMELDPTNTIARRNLDKLGTMQEATGGSSAAIDTRMFVEESGKSTAALLQAVEPDIVASLDAGDVVELKVEGNAVNAYTSGGDYIGMAEPRIGLRLAKLITAGNRYSAALITASGDVRVMIREVYQDPSQAGKVSFPRSNKVDVRAYTRRGLLQPEMEALDFGDDDDDDGDGFDDDGDDRWSDSGSDDVGDVGVNIEPEDESYD